jgi:hypothetical protein
MTIYSALLIVFVLLKLFGLLDWSWWWITAPLWGSVSFYVLVQLLRLIPRRKGPTPTLPSEHNL